MRVFAQLSHSQMHAGTAKAWHIHQQQVDWWYVPIGVLKVALHDRRPDSPTAGQTETLYMGEGHDATVLKIPPGRCSRVQGAYRQPFVLCHVISPTIRPMRAGFRTTIRRLATIGWPVRRSLRGAGYSQLGHTNRLSIR